ncbi:hypothetical protein [Streptomyces sp. NBC_01089]|uniref:hypothetical protein n=1 Tax=Streptomyces sp. NBC_01089 TaxID=2903747 RepID=UPI00386A3A6A|nr:hypothetical protein OG510_10455 [Streptomyces sp. NBC_01089]
MDPQHGKAPGSEAAGPPPAAPAPYPTAYEQAAHELGLACALVLNAPQAAAALARLVDEEHPDPEGALVLAALLHISGRYDAACSWWRFAAGAGNRTAAYTLFLDHRRRGEYRDAKYWRTQSAKLTTSRTAPDPERPETAHPRPEVRPPELRPDLLPEEARHSLLAQLHHGLPPHLPRALAEVADRLYTRGT